MTPEAIRSVLIEELRHIAPEADAAALAPDASLREEMDIDSMDFLNFVTALHHRLDVDIPEADYAHLDSIWEATRYLAARLTAEESARRAGTE